MPSSTTTSPKSSALNTPPDDLDTVSGPPMIVLDADDISQEMAARLTMALLNQMLYMKGQVPFPVTSLMKMVDRTTTGHVSRAREKSFKKKIEFLDAYDDLTCHLRTAFVALSAALAHHDALYPLKDVTRLDHACYCRPPALVHVLVVLGPSPSGGKYRFLLELNGLRVEKFGEKAYLARMAAEADSEDEESECEESEGEDVGSDGSNGLQEDFPLASQHSTSPQALSSSGHSVPPSPSPSSVLSSEASEDDENSLHHAIVGAQQLDEASLRAGERLLSRALFTSGDRLEFGDEIAPTQTHILIHAPRRFSHPAWVPRQNLGTTLDRHLRALDDSPSLLNHGKKLGRPKSSFGAGVRTVGIKVNCRNSVIVEDHHSVSRRAESDIGQDELDELIWWSWDGKLVGFSD